MNFKLYTLVILALVMNKAIAQDYTPKYTIKDDPSSTNKFTIGMEFDLATIAATEIFNGTVYVFAPKTATAAAISSPNWIVANDISNSTLQGLPGSSVELAADWKLYAFSITSPATVGANPAGTDVPLFDVTLTGVDGGEVMILNPEAASGTLDAVLVSVGADNTLDIDPDGSGPVQPDTNGNILPAPSGPVSLPVTLISFEAIAKNTDALLTWSTQSELNNDYFIVEYSLDGTRSFLRAGVVKGKGTTLFRSDYSYIHRAVGRIQSSGVYYRLTQVDYDGRTEVLPIRYVSFGKEAKKYSLYPSPVMVGAEMKLDAPNDTNTTYTIYDISGTAVLRQSSRTIQTLNLHPGYYNLVINDKNVVLPFVVIR